MTPDKLNVCFAFFPYGGTGGTSMEVPNVRDWFYRAGFALSNTGKVGSIKTANYSDTPITMTRNMAVVGARKAKADILVMVDSDMWPDLYAKEPSAKPFIDSSFKFMCERRDAGLVTTRAAPYCGPPPAEDVYVFKWEDDVGNDTPAELKMYSREEAAVMSGIREANALATGLIMFDMEIFELTDPKHEYAHLEAEIGRDWALRITRPWFYYEWKDIYASDKVSTEDAVCTRDIGFMAALKLGYNPMFCNWDSWAGHWKPKCVGKPKPMNTAHVNSKYLDAVRREMKNA